MIKKILLVLLLTFGFIFKSSFALESSWDGIKEAKLRIISPLNNTNMTNSILIGLEYQLDNGWKTYWKSPGAGGFPQEINFEKSANIDNLEISWPSPEEFSILGLNSLGYKNEVIFPININLINNYDPVNINLNVNFLICKEICIPGNASLNLTIPNGSNASLTEHAHKIEKYKSFTPLENNNLIDLDINNSLFSSNENDKLLELKISNSRPFNSPKIYIDSDYGFPIVQPILEFNETKTKLNAKFLYKDFKTNSTISNLIVHISDFPLIYEEKIILNFSQNNDSVQFLFFQIILIAFVGGLILNFMPCVLPVLSIKLLATLNYSNNNLSKIRIGFINTTLGIVTSYALLATFLIGLKSLGYGIGWGMQFQNPFFLIVISIILLFFSYNLLGLFEFSLPNSFFSLSTKLDNNVSLKDFFTGFLATAMATPCSAPFVGTAITFAFTQNSLNMLITFISMGIGMSFPYILVSIFPSSIKLLPKPGKWMKMIRYIMAILLLATLIWIGTILSKHYTIIFLLISIVFSVLILIIFIFKKRNSKENNYYNFVIALITLFFLFLSFVNFFQKYSEKKLNESILFDEKKLLSLIEDKKFVFVDITADWCLTCKYNKQQVLYTEEIQNLFKSNNIIQITGDWTLPDENIRNYLNRYNKFGIPFNILYSHKFPEGIIFSELLTKNDIKEAVNLINNE